MQKMLVMERYSSNRFTEVVGFSFTICRQSLIAHENPHTKKPKPIHLKKNVAVFSVLSRVVEWAYSSLKACCRENGWKGKVRR